MNDQDRSATASAEPSTSTRRVPGFVHRRAAHCATGSLRDLIEHHGLSYTGEPISEAFVFGLAGGLGFAFGEFPDLRPPFILLGRTGDLEKDLCQNLSLPFELRQTDDE